jgi:2-polyprenyl-6-methoxyphenol hydroxylase-like FAD-dependent oxidoreductase
MRFNMRLKSIEEKNGVVSAHFNDGETLQGDLLVGCDGIHSPTRAYVVGSDVKPDFANASIIIGLSKLSMEDEEAANLKGVNAFFGTQANVGLFPVDPQGTCIWQVSIMLLFGRFNKTMSGLQYFTLRIRQEGRQLGEMTIRSNN